MTKTATILTVLDMKWFRLKLNVTHLLVLPWNKVPSTVLFVPLTTKSLFLFRYDSVPQFEGVTGSLSHSCHLQMFAVLHGGVCGPISLLTKADVDYKSKRMHNKKANIQLCKLIFKLQRQECGWAECVKRMLCYKRGAGPAQEKHVFISHRPVISSETLKDSSRVSGFTGSWIWSSAVWARIQSTHLSESQLGKEQQQGGEMG